MADSSNSTQTVDMPPRWATHEARPQDHRRFYEGHLVVYRSDNSTHKQPYHVLGVLKRDYKGWVEILKCVGSNQHPVMIQTSRMEPAWMLEPRYEAKMATQFYLADGKVYQLDRHHGCRCIIRYGGRVNQPELPALPALFPHQADRPEAADADVAPTAESRAPRIPSSPQNLPAAEEAELSAPPASPSMWKKKLLSRWCAQMQASFTPPQRLTFADILRMRARKRAANACEGAPSAADLGGAPYATNHGGAPSTAANLSSAVAQSARGGHHRNVSQRSSSKSPRGASRPGAFYAGDYDDIPESAAAMAGLLEPQSPCPSREKDPLWGKTGAILGHAVPQQGS